MDRIAPKYHHLKQELIRKIEDEQYQAGQAIPSERELIQSYGLSRITVRRAVDDLVREGYLYKVQGKGTFVCNERYKQDLISLNSCSQDIEALGFRVSRKLLAAERIPADKKRSHRLGIAEGAELFRLERVYYADETPINYTTSYIPLERVPGIERFDFSTRSLYEVFEQDYGIHILRARRSIEAILADEEVADRLELAPGDPVLRFVAITYAELNGQELPIESFTCHYRNDRFKFFIDQHR